MEYLNFHSQKIRLWTSCLWSDVAWNNLKTSVEFICLEINSSEFKQMQTPNKTWTSHKNMSESFQPKRWWDCCTYLSGLSEAQTESISPTSRVPCTVRETQITGIACILHYRHSPFSSWTGLELKTFFWIPIAWVEMNLWERHEWVIFAP